jgi:hypothetical protein
MPSFPASATEAREYFVNDRDWYRFAPLGPRLGRSEAAFVCRAQPWQQHRHADGDTLATRALVLRVHGWETLHNMIRGAHGLPNRY